MTKEPFWANHIGSGCSGRNGGQAGYSIKPSYTALAKKWGAERAFRICREGFNAVEYFQALVAGLGVDVGYRCVGSFVGAHTAKHFRALAAEAKAQPKGLEHRIEIVERRDQYAEIRTDFYHGGCVYPDEALIQPMRLVLALLARSRHAGARVIEHCRAERIEKGRDGFTVHTTRGAVHARNVLIATNGYTDHLVPWIRRRIIPIGSHQLATAVLGADKVRSLIPRGRSIVDTRRVIVYYRPSPDGERIVFGGRAALSESRAHAWQPRLVRMLAQIFPDLADAGTTHAWAGSVCFTFDMLPHLGHYDGIHYALGYCGQGVPNAAYFGMRIGQQILGHADGKTALDDLPFPARFYYWQSPWFMAPAILGYRVLDRLGI